MSGKVKARRIRPEGVDVDMLAASLLAGEGKKQIEIADLLGLSQTAISRLLAEAHKEYLREELRFLSDKITPEVMQKVLQRIATLP